MNLVLSDTEEFRRVKRKQTKSAAPGASSSTTQTVESEEKRTLGLTIVRGAHIVSLSVESAPPADPSTRLGKSTPGGLPTGLTSGPGVARPAGRGAAPTSLAVSNFELSINIVLYLLTLNNRARPLVWEAQLLLSLLNPSVHLDSGLAEAFPRPEISRLLTSLKVHLSHLLVSPLVVPRASTHRQEGK